MFSAVTHGCAATHASFSSVRTFTIELAARTVTGPLFASSAHFGTVVVVTRGLTVVAVVSPTAPGTVDDAMFQSAVVDVTGTDVAVEDVPGALTSVPTSSPVPAHETSARQSAATSAARRADTVSRRGRRRALRGRAAVRHRCRTSRSTPSPTRTRGVPCAVPAWRSARPAAPTRRPR